MTAFLLTWKDKVWPYANIQRMLAKFAANGYVDEAWRIRSNRRAKVGDRVWLLRQGKGPKIVFGSGRIIAPVDKAGDNWGAPVRFERFVDPKTSYLVSEIEVRKALRISQINAQASGDPLTDAQDAIFASIASFHPLPLQSTDDGAAATNNPDWVRDELILALDVYLQNRKSPPPKGGTVIQILSKDLRSLGMKLFRFEDKSHTFRNEAGVYMKLMNFRRLDPQYTSKGQVGLSRGSKAEEEV
jgi:hypothetical protein